MLYQEIYEIFYKIYKNVDLAKLLCILSETYNEKVLLKQQLKRYFNSRWYDRYKYNYHQKQGNKNIAFFSDFYYRIDHYTIFINFINNFSEFDYVIPIKLPKERINVLRGLKMMKWDICNLWLMRNINMQFKERIYWIRVLGLIRFYCVNMERYLTNKPYSYGLVYNDSNPYENILVQLMKQKGMHTATLQHGIFDKYGYWKGIEFRTSVADDWLAWNIYTKELAMECGIPEKKIKVLGIPRYITPITIEKKNKLGIFSVVLGGKELFNQNEDLINFANILAKEQGLKYFVRYHPTYKGDEYNKVINKQYYVQRNNLEESISQMCQQSDFTLVGSGTSMIIDLIYLNQPFFQYYKKWDGDTNKKRENYFRNYEELKEQAQKGAMVQSEEMFRYYCITKDVKNSYAIYFSSFQ